MACKDCAERRRKLMDAILLGKIAEAKDITVEGLRVMIGIDAAADHRSEAEPGPLDQSIEKLSEYLETVTDADEIAVLLGAEIAGKSRAGAIAALDARRDALTAA